MRTAKKQRLVKVVGFRLMAVTGLTLTLIWLVTCATWYRRDENEDKSIGKLVGHRQKLLCFILSNPDRVASSVSVKETWGSRCDGLLFFSSKSIPQLPSVVLPPDAGGSVDGYYRLWGKVRGIWKHLRAQHFHHFDWFLKADDDTYIVVDNLRNFLEHEAAVSTTGPIDGRQGDSNQLLDVPIQLTGRRQQPKERAVWFGARLRHPKVTGGYHSGGAGYVLNRRALELFDDGRNCSQMNFGYEDLEMGRCLEKIGVDVIDTRDSKGLATFLPFSPEELLVPRRPNDDILNFNDPLSNSGSWYWKAVWWPHQLGRNCCSPHVISFHHVKPKMMYAMDFLIYSLRLDQLKTGP